MASTLKFNNTSPSFQCPITFDFDPANITHFPRAAVQLWISLATINAVTSLPTVLINLLVIVAVLDNEQLRSSSYNLVVTVLSLSDLLVGLVVQPLYTAMMVGILFHSTYICELVMAYSTSGILCSAWSTVTMAIISLERYLFIEYPVYYRTVVTSKKLMKATAVSWVLVGAIILISWLQIYESLWARHLPVVLTVGPSFVIIFFCVTKVHLTARRQIKAIAAQQQPVAQQSAKVREYKRSLTLGLIVVASVACLCPILISKIAGAVTNWRNKINYVQGVTSTFLHLQSIINPIIYSLRLSDIRSGVKKRFCSNRR